MQQYKAFTAKCVGIASALQSQCGICRAVSVDELNRGIPHPEVKEYIAIWDTGASRTCISQKVVDELGLQIVGYGDNHTAGGTVTSTMHMINILLPSGVGIHSLLVSCCNIDSADVLIGMDVISKGDFAVTNVGGKTTFSFRIPSLETIDYLKDPKAHTMPIVKDKTPRRNDPCPCGSGKKFKDCHGKGIYHNK